ncbi:MAG TPA: hypothetical protein VMU48_00485 [Terracidiphilus sp.]|nr:hypothetical protein [Terracidiphilus sp.]
MDLLRNSSETLRANLNQIQEAIENQVSSIRYGTQRCEEKERKQRITIARAIVRAASTVPRYEQTQRDKEHSLQWKMFWVTLFGALAAASAAAGAFYYAGIAKGQLDAMNQTLLQTESQAQAAWKSEWYAQKSEADTRQLFYQDERAWVGFSGFSMQPDPSHLMSSPIIPGPYHPNSAVSEIINSGKTPANQTQGIAGFTLLPFSHVFSEKDEEWMRKMIRDVQSGKSKAEPIAGSARGEMEYAATSPIGSAVLGKFFVGSIAPGVHAKFTQPTHWGPFKAEAFPVVFGQLSYIDVSGKTRATSFCVYQTPNTPTGLTICPVFNEMK